MALIISAAQTKELIGMSQALKAVEDIFHDRPRERPVVFRGVALMVIKSD